MKKSTVIIIVIIAVALCCAATGASALIIWLISSAGKPEVTYTEVIQEDPFNSETTFKYETEAEYTETYTSTTNPQDNFEMKAKYTVYDGKYDLEKNNAEEKQLATYEYSDGTTVTRDSEAREIDGILYSKSGDEDFVSFQSHDEQESQGEVFYVINVEVIKTLSGNEEIETLEEEVLHGESCYHYKIKLDRDNIEVELRWFRTTAGDFVSNNFGLDEIDFKNPTLELWISKERREIFRAQETIDSLSVGSGADNSLWEYRYEDIKHVTDFYGWGSPVEIVTPI